MRFFRGLFTLQVKTNFVSYVVVAVALWIVPDTSGFLRFLLVMILIGRTLWNSMWLGDRMLYYARHPEKDTPQELARNIPATTVRTLEIMVLGDSLFSSIGDYL